MVSRKAKLRIEAPVNGGRNYEQDTAHDMNRKRNCSSVNKLGYMLEHPVKNPALLASFAKQ